MATKNTTKVPAGPADAPTTDENTPAPAPDTTEANNADEPEQLPEAPAADQAATEPAVDGAAEHEAPAPKVTATGGAPEQLRDDGPTVAEFVAAGYNPKHYPPSGYASKSSLSEIQAAIEAHEAASNLPPPPPLPKRIKLVTPYGFYDDADKLHMWQAGHETDDPDEIELLVTRGAEFEFLE